MIKKLDTLDADTLQSMAYEPLPFLVEDLLPPGLHLLAGAPKIGKSWLALWLCLQMAQGKPLWNFSTRPCEVLYLCLEEWQELLCRLDELERHTEAHTALLREVIGQREQSTTPAQMEALTRDVAEIRAMLQPVGKRNGRRLARCRRKLPRPRLPHLEGPTWFVLVMTLAVLLLLWWAWAGDWSSLSRLRL